MAKTKGIDLGVMIETWKRCNFSNHETARQLGCDRTNVIRRLRHAYDAGDERIDPDKLFNRPPPQSRTLEEINRARVELGMRREAKVTKGDWRKPSLITKITDPVFVLGFFGDPHLDNPGSDLDLFEEELERMDPANGVYGICIGDVFDNWVRVLAHAGQASTDPYCAWVVFEDMIQRHPFLSLILGNHDLWNTGTANVVTELCRPNGVLVRRSGGRLIINTGHGTPLTISARHIWAGNSQYSEAHGLKRAVTFGHTEDDIVTGGHFHKGEVREHVRPHDGKVSKLIMLDSFKDLDDHANDRGFMSAKRKPIVWCAIDTRQPVTSHERVMPFYDFNAARAMAEHMRGKNA